MFKIQKGIQKGTDTRVFVAPPELCSSRKLSSQPKQNHPSSPLPLPSPPIREATTTPVL
jgi:hypothetical protein